MFYAASSASSIVTPVRGVLYRSSPSGTGVIIALPSQRSLRDYTHAFREKYGFSAESDQQLVSHPDVRGVEDWKRHVVLLLDEMHIKEDLVSNKHTGALVGFVNLSDMTVHLEEFEQSLISQVNSPAPPALANSSLVIMVRVLFTKIRIKYVQFTCLNLTGEQIFPIFWEAVYRIEWCQLKVIATTFDEAAPNRKFLELHRTADSADEIIHKVKNLYT